MKKHDVAKLRLNSEVLRLLADARLQSVAGGEFAGANQSAAQGTSIGCP
jgi:hypothetical protein